MRPSVYRVDESAGDIQTGRPTRPFSLVMLFRYPTYSFCNACFALAFNRKNGLMERSIPFVDREVEF